ncbi:MAG: hypothetical protein E7616_08575 [Ruminococcaceae bacterium]|nr:hypothetical protein [Oscillospiraceae bacterium]
MANKKLITSALGRFSNSTSTDGDTSFKKDNTADYTVKKKVEGKYKLHRMLYLVIFFVIIIALCAILMNISPFVIALVPVFAWMIWFFTHRYVDIQYSYAIEDGALIATEIYGEKADKLLLHIKMPSIIKTAPYEGAYKREIDSMTDVAQRVEVVGSMSDLDIYCSIFRTEDGKTGLFFFNGTEKTLRAFRYYNSENTIINIKK